MSEGEKSERLVTLAELLPVELARSLKPSVIALKAQVTGLLGTASGAEEILGSIDAAAERLSAVAAQFEVLKGKIVERAEHYRSR